MNSKLRGDFAIRTPLPSPGTVSLRLRNTHRIDLEHLQQTTLNHPGCSIEVSMDGAEYGFTLCFTAEQVHTLTTDELNKIIDKAFDASFD